MILLGGENVRIEKGLRAVNSTPTFDKSAGEPDRVPTIVLLEDFTFNQEGEQRIKLV